MILQLVVYLTMHVNKTKDLMTARLLLVLYVHKNVNGILITTDHYGFESDSAFVNPAYSSACDNHPGYKGDSKMKQEKCEEQAVIIGIVENRIVQDQKKENNNYAQERGHKRSYDIIKPGAPVNIVIKTCEIIKHYPCEGESGCTRPETRTKSNWNVNTKDLRFYM